jgi:hypothetical protein
MLFSGHVDANALQAKASTWPEKGIVWHAGEQIFQMN